MSTRCATVITQKPLFNSRDKSEEVLRFYRHYDGYPEGHGVQLAYAIDKIWGEETFDMSVNDENVIMRVLDSIIKNIDTQITIESHNTVHGDLDYVYFVDIKPEKTGRIGPHNIIIYIHYYHGENDYLDIFKKKTPIFKGTVQELINKYTS